MQRSLAHRLESGSTAAKRGSTGWRLLPALALASALGLTALAASASAQPIGPFELVAENSGKCMDVRGGPNATANGSVIQQWGCWNGPNQQWYFTAVGNGRYEVTARNSGKCLDVTGGPNAKANGTRLQIWGCWGGANQLWSPEFTPFPNKQTLLMPASSTGSCADVTGGPGAVANGIPLQIWGCWGGSNQLWTFTSTTPYLDPLPASTRPRPG